MLQARHERCDVLKLEEHKYGGGLEVSKAKRLWTLEAERPSAEAAAS